MITIRVYPAVREAFTKNKLNLHMELEFGKDPRDLKYFWLAAWRLNRRNSLYYFIYAIENIIRGIHIMQLPIKGIRDILVNHPDLEEKYGLDSDHVIIDKSVYNLLRVEQ